MTAVDTLRSGNSLPGPRPSYARRAGAVALAALLTAAGAKGVQFIGENLDNVWGNRPPVFSEGDPGTRVHVVESGDTFWNIAAETKRPGDDIRAVVDTLEQQPDALDGLHAGDRLVVRDVEANE